MEDSDLAGQQKDRGSAGGEEGGGGGSVLGIAERAPGGVTVAVALMQIVVIHLFCMSLLQPNDCMLLWERTVI